MFCILCDTACMFLFHIQVLKTNQIYSLTQRTELGKIIVSVFISVSHRSHCKEVGQILVLGQGDVGQLGLGENILERKKPALVSLSEKIVQVVAGGMHTVCLTETGQVSKHLSCLII